MAGLQTFTFTGTLSTDGTSMVGTYTSTAGTASDGSPCGTAQTGLQWSATSVPPLLGPVTGSFHSTGGVAGLGNQDFVVSGSLTQGENIGASNATVTGSLSFLDPVTQLSAYPCFGIASLNGQISGNSVILQIVGTDGSNLGQIGGTVGSGLATVTFDTTTLGSVLHSKVGTAYGVNSPTCQGVGLANAGDSGNICLALGGTKACQEPVIISPAVLTFPAQLLGSAPTAQKITITNNDASGNTLDGLRLQWNVPFGSFGGQSDFNSVPNFTEQDTCAASLGSTFSLGPAQSCTVTISFAPQQSCPWLPFPGPPSVFAAPPAYCPTPLTALLTVNSPSSADGDLAFTVPVTGTGLSVITPSTQELDFGAEALTESSLPQTLSFTNHGPNSVQILGGTCTNPSNGIDFLPNPLQLSSPVAGLQVLENGPGVVGIAVNGSSISYLCDLDPGTSRPNFQITSDTCSGQLLASQATCSVQVAFVPQSALGVAGLDFFLELNTVQCSSADNVTSNCEIDAGRFPVELKSNPSSPLRMSPGAGLDFGTQPVGKRTSAQTITLFNDPNDPNTATVSFVGKVSVKGNYAESDDCPFSLAPGASCTLTVTFKPSAVGFSPGSLTLNVTPEPTGAPQIVYLRGTGQ
jgi:hypothetical protein